MLRSAIAKTLPPRPPSPPLGPPKGMNFSRRKLTQPAPPLPAAMSMVASSTNFMVGRFSKDKAPAGRGLALQVPSAQAGVTNTVWRFNAPLTSNDTLPSTSANKV